MRLLAIMLLAACDSASPMMENPDLSMMAAGHDLAMQPGADLAGADLATAMTGDMAKVTSGGIPDPGAGSMVDNNFGDVEPNDTPATATPLGTSAQANVYLWVSNNTGGGTDTSDYYVFKTGATSTMFTLSTAGICWSGGITGIDATLWEVANGQQVMPPVKTWMSTASCTPPGAAITVKPSTEYLLGLTFTGASGSYFA
jgi:hypothetical protein